jgi:hypothetical protein
MQVVALVIDFLGRLFKHIKSLVIFKTVLVNTFIVQRLSRLTMFIESLKYFQLLQNPDNTSHEPWERGYGYNFQRMFP